MTSDLIYLAISFLYIGILVLIGLILYRCLHVRAEGVRKFIHILTSLWIFIVEYRLSSPWAKLIGPFLFTIINGLFSRSRFSYLLGMDDRERGNGLMYYPLSIFILVLLEIAGVLSPSSVIAGVLVMGWGDGLAALAGSRFGRNSYLVYGKYKKSIEGTAVMFAASAVIIVIFTDMEWYYAASVAFVAALMENVTPLGLDNLSVPIIVSLLSEVICSL